MIECAKYRWDRRECSRCACSLSISPNQFKDAILPQVLATPVMILVMENAALNAIRPFLDEGESAVGTAIDVRHLAATPVGHDVRAEAEVTRVEGRRIEFKATASDEAGIESGDQVPSFLLADSK